MRYCIYERLCSNSSLIGVVGLMLCTLVTEKGTASGPEAVTCLPRRWMCGRDGPRGHAGWGQTGGLSISPSMLGTSNGNRKYKPPGMEVSGILS